MADGQKSHRLRNNWCKKTKEEAVYQTLMKLSSLQNFYIKTGDYRPHTEVNAITWESFISFSGIIQPAAAADDIN